jgi:hypothetical protein
MLEDWNELQLEMCSDAGVKPVALRADEKVGIARNVRSGLLPINGVRHLPENGTCGWYIWAGEMSDDPDFFRAAPCRASCGVVRGRDAFFAIPSGLVLHHRRKTVEYVV